MPHSSMCDQCQDIKQEIYNLVDWSSQWCIKDEDDIADYITAFWLLCEPLLTSYYMSLTECKDLFWQGFHPDDCAKISPQVEQQNQDLLQRVLPQFAECTCRTLPTLSSPACTPSLPISKTLTLPADLIATVAHQLCLSTLRLCLPQLHLSLPMHWLSLMSHHSRLCLHRRRYSVDLKDLNLCLPPQCLSPQPPLCLSIQVQCHLASH